MKIRIDGEFSDARRVELIIGDDRYLLTAEHGVLDIMASDGRISIEPTVSNRIVIRTVSR